MIQDADPPEAAPEAAPLALGKALREQERHPEAAQQLRRALEANPDCVEARFELGLALLLSQDALPAEEQFRGVLARSPDHLLALLNLGNALNSMGRFAEAAEFYQRSLDVGEPFPTGFNNLGKALQGLGRLDEAVAAYEKGLELEPESALLFANLSSVFEQMGSPERMTERCEATLARNPDSFEGQLNLCIAKRLEGKLDEALAAGKRATQLNVNSAAAHFQLGQTWHDKQRFHEAAICFENTLEADPGFSPAHNSLAGTLNGLGKLDEALRHWKQAIEISPDFDVAHSNRLLCMNYDAGCTREELAEAHRAWGRRVANRPAKKAGVNPATTEERQAKRLRVGYVSADFRGHPVASFAEPIVTSHDPDRIEVTCYSCTPAEDEITARFKASAARWRDVKKLSDDALAQAIRDDEIDILIDLSGHTGGTRLGVFAQKPAPVQVTWIGYPNTTGLATMDWRITDAYADPPGLTESLHTEQLARMPKSFLCFQAPTGTPEPRPVPPNAEGYFTFGAFNNLIKIGPQGVAAWSRILLELPESRLLMKNASLANDRVRARVEGMFAAHGVSADRLQLMGRVSREAHFALFNQIGLHLDPFPYNGTATTFEASWMGVPTLTLAGDRHAARVGVSHNMNLGLPELIGESVDDYVGKAVEFGRDPTRLRDLKVGFRERLQASPLMDHAAATRALECIFHDMWRARPLGYTP